MVLGIRSYRACRKIKTNLLKFGTQKGFQKFEEYHNYYLKLDLLLLADVFQLFRRNTMQANLIEPCYLKKLQVIRDIVQ